MPDGQLLMGFIVASVIVLVIPGPGVLYVVAQSARHGLRAGLASVIGLSLGAFVHVVAAVVGLSAVLATSATAFNLVKLIGAGYLIYLGIRVLMSRNRGSQQALSVRLPVNRLIWDGVLISVFNPKIAVFFLAFLPQFVDLGQGHVSRQVFFLGMLYILLAIISDGTYAVIASAARRTYFQRISQSNAARYVTGSVFIGLGINTALTGKGN